MQGDIGGDLAVREVAKSKNHISMSKMGKFKAIISDMRDTIRNSLLRVVSNISRGHGNKKRFRKFERTWELFHLEDDFGKYVKRARQFGKCQKCGRF